MSNENAVNGGKGLASLEQLLAAGRDSGGQKKRRYKTVTLPVSGLTVRIRSLTEKEISEYQMAAMSRTGGPGTVARNRLEDASRRLFVLCVVDGDGRPLFNESHLSVLEDWDGVDSSYLYEECATHCGLRRTDIEALVKNSEGTSVGG